MASGIGFQPVIEREMTGWKPIPRLNLSFTREGKLRTTVLP
jgi:hypothetical protein